MNKKEIILALILVSYLLVFFSIEFIEKSEMMKINSTMPIPMVELHANGTTRSYEVPNPVEFNYFLVLMYLPVLYIFPILLSLMGMGFWGIFFGMSHWNPENLPFLVIIPVLLSVASMFLIIRYTKDLDMWKRIVFTYLYFVFISGFPLLLNAENVGR